MFGQQCPVCTLYLHMGMKLEEHLETHPKEQVIKALVLLASSNVSTASATSLQPTGALCGNFNNSIIQSSRVINKAINPLPPTQPQNFVIVNSTSSTKFFQRRRNSAYIVKDPLCNTNFLITENTPTQSVLLSRPKTPIPVPVENSYVEKYEASQYSNSEDYDDAYEEEEEPQQYEEIYDDKYKSNEFIQNSDEFSEDKIEYVGKSEEPMNILCDPENLEQTDETCVNALYYENDKGEFVVDKNPKSVLEYTEKDDGGFSVTERLEQSTAMKEKQENINDTREKPKGNLSKHNLIDVNNPENLLNLPRSNVDSMELVNKKIPAGLKVLSNVKLTPDMISSGIKEIIISAKSANKNDNKKQIDILPLKQEMKIEPIEFKNEPLETITSQNDSCNMNLNITSVIRKSIILSNTEKFDSLQNNENSMESGTSVPITFTEDKLPKSSVIMLAFNSESKCDGSDACKENIIDLSKIPDLDIKDVDVKYPNVKPLNLSNVDASEILQTEYTGSNKASCSVISDSSKVLCKSSDNLSLDISFVKNSSIKPTDLSLTQSKNITKPSISLVKKGQFINKAPKKLILKLKKRYDDDIIVMDDENANGKVIKQEIDFENNHIEQSSVLSSPKDGNNMKINIEDEELYLKTFNNNICNTGDPEPRRVLELATSSTNVIISSNENSQNEFTISKTEYDFTYDALHTNEKLIKIEEEDIKEEFAGNLFVQNEVTANNIEITDDKKEDGDSQIDDDFINGHNSQHSFECVNDVSVITTNEKLLNSGESNSCMSGEADSSLITLNKRMQRRIQLRRKRLLKIRNLKYRKREKSIKNEMKRKKRITKNEIEIVAPEIINSSSDEPITTHFKFKKRYSNKYDMSLPGNSKSTQNAIKVEDKEILYDKNNIESTTNVEIVCDEKMEFNVQMETEIEMRNKALEEEICYLITDIETTDYVKHEDNELLPPTEIKTLNEEVDEVKTLSWSSQITSAIETIESHISDNLSSPVPCSSSSVPESKTQTPIPSSNNCSNDNDIIWQTFTNPREDYTADINQAGPSRAIDYRAQNNFFMGNYEQEFLFSNEKPNRFMEFIEDGQTATWRHPFSPQFANIDSDRNSYTDLDACKVNSTYNRAPSTESLNIRTDEKMPARGEISEQESNGEIDVPWNNHQAYPSYFQPEHSLPKYPHTYEDSKEFWKNHNLTSFPQNITKFPPISSTSNEIPAEESREKETKKERKPRTYRCLECNTPFTKLKLRRIHMEAEHPNLIENKPIITTLLAPSSTATTTITSFPKNEIKIEGVTKVNYTTVDNSQNIVYSSLDAKPEVMGFNELKRELLQNITGQEEKPKVESLKLKKRKIYGCQKCQEEFKNLKSFNSHLLVHPAECQQCGKLFHTWYNLSLHLKRHLGIKNHVCMCGKGFLIKQKLIEHMRIHTGVTPISCPDCNRKFRRYSNLIQHRNRHHLNIKPEQKDYLCHCGEVLHSKAKFIWHKEIHENKPKGCPFCRERFIHQNSLTRHIRLSHEDKYWDYQNTAVSCPICMQLITKNSIKHHINKHNMQTEYKCNICNKAFSTKWNLKQHRWVHACRSTKPYKCKVCVAAFVRETDYKTHMNVHKSIKPFTCNYCGLQFSRKYNWLRHTKEHESPKKFKCNICNKAFHRAYYLTEHMRIHTGERPFTCNICGKTSATKTNHNKHVVIHHARDPLAAEG